MKHSFSRFFIYTVLMVPIGSCSTPEPDPLPETDHHDTYTAVFTAVDYRPAPGQFVNEMPEADASTTKEKINDLALASLNNGDLISLGSLGGSVTMTLSKPIYNSVSQRADFVVLGNAYTTSVENGVTYGSAEPGIVYVMEDANGNGRPDDTWYALRGQDWDKVRQVTVTYTDVDSPSADRWVDWTLSDGTSGVLTCNPSYHTHSYFPLWENKTSMTFDALMLPVNGSYDSALGRYTQICLKGYADSFPNNSDEAVLSLDDAVDAEGNPVHVTRADFVRVVSAVLQSNGPMGECSTEVAGIRVLHN